MKIEPSEADADRLMSIFTGRSDDLETLQAQHARQMRDMRNLNRGLLILVVLLAVVTGFSVTTAATFCAEASDG